jgi:hypothetical protein
MRRVAVLCLLSLLAGIAAPAATSSGEDCCPMGGGMSCCPNKTGSERGCGIQRCAPEGTTLVALQFPRALVETGAVEALNTDSEPAISLAPASTDSPRPDPDVPPPRA